MTNKALNSLCSVIALYNKIIVFHFVLYLQQEQNVSEYISLSGQIAKQSQSLHVFIQNQIFVSLRPDSSHILLTYNMHMMESV